jgi:hypothetical protein
MKEKYVELIKYLWINCCYKGYELQDKDKHCDDEDIDL